MIHTQAKIRSRYAETDQMGFVHHQHYVQYLEYARVEMLDEIGCPYKQLESEGFFLPVLEVKIKYRSPNTFDDRLVVHCFMKKLPSVKIHLHYEIYNGDKLTTTGESLHAFMDPNGRPTRPPKHLIDLCKPFFDSDNN